MYLYSKKTTAWVVVILAVGILLLLFYPKTARLPAPEQSLSDPRNIVYTIEGAPVGLSNGMAENGGVKTSVFEANTQGDLNGDGLADTAVILTQDTGGSGTFFYAAAAIKTANGYIGTNAVLMGDRVAPQPSQITNGLMIVNFAERNPGEPFSVSPSLGKSLYLKFSNGTLSTTTQPNIK